VGPIPERTVSVGLVADVSNYLAGMQRASASTTALGKNAQTTGDLTRGFVAKVGGSISSLGNQIGGTFGQLLSTVGNDIDKVSSKSARLSTALEVGGGAAVAAGIGLEQLASGAIQATDQLNAAIVTSGDSVSDYSKGVEEAVTANENLGHSAEDTKQAITTLIPAAGSTSAALDKMQVTANLAAAKHESLATAAVAVARILNGSGSRTLSIYGIHMDGIGTKAQQGARALDELNKKLSGQSAAAVNNFSGQVGIATTHIEDFVKEAAGPAGQVLVGFGIAASGTGVVIDLLRLRTERAAVAQLAMNAAAAESVVPLEAEAAAATEASVAHKGLGGSLAALATGPVGFAAVGIAALYGVSALLTMTNAANNNTISFKNAAAASKAFQKQVNLSTSVGPIASPFGASRGSVLVGTTGLSAAVESAAKSVGLQGLGPQLEGSAATVKKIDTALAGLVSSGNAKTAAEEFNKWKDAAKQAGISTADLNADFPAYIKALKDTGTTLDKTSGSTLVFADATKEQAKALADATSAAIKSVSPLTDFGSVVTDVQKKLQDSATATAAATRSTKDSAANFYDGSSVSLAQFTDQLTQNDAAGQAWLDNIQKLAQTQPEIAAQFEAAGYTAVNSSLLQQLIDATPEQSAAYIKAQTDAIALSGKAAADALLADPYLEEAGHAISEKTATALGASIAAGVPVATALHDLGVKVSATPLNIPVTADVSGADGKISGLLHKFAGVSTVFTVKGSGRASANGNMFVGAHAQAFANGGEGIYSGGAPLYKFAEPETGWEAFISGRPGQNARNRQIWQAAGEKLGVSGGGSTDNSSVNNIHVTEVSDPVGTANAVIRRLNLAKS
jgi:hypothetical protein